MLCLRDFELYSRWVPLIIVTSFMFDDGDDDDEVMMMMDVAGAMKICIINVAGIVNIRLSSF